MFDADNGRLVANLASALLAPLPEQAGDATPGMGAERMAMTWWLSGILWWNFGYQPRHRSTRQAPTAHGRVREPWDGPVYGWASPSRGPEPPTVSWAMSPAGPDFIAQPTHEQLRP